MTQIKVLIVEDSSDDCLFLVRFLEKNGFSVEYQQIETEEAMKQSLRQNWDLILSDFTMPQFSAPQAFELLKEIGHDIPFIIISGAVGEDIAIESIRSGVSDYILKSNLSRLVPAIHRELKALHSRKEHRKTQIALKQAEDQLRQAQKMEAMGQLAGSIAHDFNNLLSVMHIYCHKIKTLAKSSDIIDYVEKLIQVQSKSSALTKQLLTFSRKRPAEIQTVDVNKLLNSLQAMLESVVGSNSKLKISLNPQVGCILANESQLEQIIVNLAVNARDAMAGGGIVEIKTYPTIFSEPQLIGTSQLAAGTYMTIEVSDTGVGIEPENLNRIFEPFFTTKELGKGTGLGLSIIYGIVHQYLGAISVESEIQKGTRFKIFFPESNTQVQPLTSPNKITIGRAHETILLVEDEEELRRLLCDILSQVGYRVLESENGNEALQVIQNKKQKVDLILSDLMMPKLDGLQLYKEVRKLDPEVSFLYMSGFFRDPLPQEFSYIEKPFTNESLLEKVRLVLDSHEKHQNPLS